MNPLGHIRQATSSDMAIIHSWLPRDGSSDTLASNWNLTMDMFDEGCVYVWEDAATLGPVGYCWGSLNSHDSILEVKPSHRGKGVGRALASFMLDQSIAGGEPLLEIQIAPESAEPFWRALGFKTFWERSHCYGRRVLELTRATPAGKNRSIVVKFFPEEAAWEEGVQPLAVHRLEGVEVPEESKIALGTTVAHFGLSDGADLVVEVAIDGQRCYQGKAKYSEAAALGVQRCRNGFLIREILTAGLPPADSQ